MLQERCDFGVYLIAGELYVTGGVDSNNSKLLTVARYSMTSNTWSSVAEHAPIPV